MNKCSSSAAVAPSKCSSSAAVASTKLVSYLFCSLLISAIVLVSACATQTSGAKISEQKMSESNVSAQDTFKRLTGLDGKWRGVFADGREHTITLRLSAAGTVLVETWALSPTRESITIYNLDGEHLLATHFCPHGNQPRLVLDSGNAQDGFTFEFLDGTGLQNPEASHQHRMWIKPIDAMHFERSEIYINNRDTAISDDTVATRELNRALWTIAI
jgi:hypothetical protein